MHRYTYHRLSWGDLNDDAADVVDTVTEWVETDRQGRSNRLFYFLHFFDAHFPYIPPASLLSDDVVDFGLVKTFRDEFHTDDYLCILLEDPFSMEDAELDRLRSHYYDSVSHVGYQLARSFAYMKQFGLFKESQSSLPGTMERTS